jgi:hypothetical protein
VKSRGGGPAAVGILKGGSLAISALDIFTVGPRGGSGFCAVAEDPVAVAVDPVV